MWPVAATWGTATATSVLDIVMSSDELRTAMEDATPLKRPGHVDDIASAINLEFPLTDL